MIVSVIFFEVVHLLLSQVRVSKRDRYGRASLFSQYFSLALRILSMKDVSIAVFSLDNVLPIVSSGLVPPLSGEDPDFPSHSALDAADKLDV